MKLPKVNCEADQTNVSDEGEEFVKPEGKLVTFTV